MTKTANIIRFDPNGPSGLEEWDQIDHASLVSGEPVQRGHIYHEIADNGYMVGVWDCTEFTDQMMPYAVDEYMLLLKGELAMVLPDGAEIEIKAGDAFVIPKGLECQWKQTDFVHKIFMILDGPVPDAVNASLGGISVPDLSASTNGSRVVASRTDFLNAAGTMRVDVQEFGAMSQPFVKMDANQIVTVLDGTLSLHDGARNHEFAKGETAYVHQGDIVGWKTTADTRLIVAGYTESHQN